MLRVTQGTGNMYRFITAAALSVLLLAQSVQAAPITSFGGSSGSPATVTPNTVTMPGLFINSLFNTSGGSSPVAATAFTDGTVVYNTTGQPANSATATSNLGTLKFTVNSPISTPNSGSASPGSFVSFTFNSPQSVQNAPGPSTVFGTTSGPFDELVLAANTTGIDFGPIGSKFHFLASVAGVSYSGGPSGTFSSATGAQSAAFTATLDATPIITAVPEPTSALVFGALAVGGAFMGWRRRKLA